MRICSLLPSATEIVAELGLAGSLVGVSEECDWPPEIRGLPVVTASRIDTQASTSSEIDSAVRAALADGRSLYAVDEELIGPARARPDRDAGSLRGLRRLERRRRAGPVGRR